MKRVTRILVAASALLIFACQKNSTTSGGGTTTPTCASTPSYAATVSALFATKCATAGCHAAGSTKGPGALTTYTEIYNARVACNSSISSGSMPKGSTLAAADKTAMLCWIAGGAPNN